VRVKNPGRYELEGKSFAVYDNSVPSVVATLVSDYEVHVASEKVS
jgi:hypothetical protein